MFFVIHNTADAEPGKESYSIQRYDSADSFANAKDGKEGRAGDLRIGDCDSLLRLYVATERDTVLYSQLQSIRDQFLDDLDSVNSAAEIYGLICWLLEDNGINAQGASLEETADRLSDLDIEADSDKYTGIIFHLKDAVDRLYELELD
ncbi:hypothetical protein [Amphritea sp. HPY]|uniref:hypothetical protein n=1 Tax=Amphritea sp. HPY TaxID=3421652 RepID=UPI003D7DD3E6